jgi:hypothetical protein
MIARASAYRRCRVFLALLLLAAAPAGRAAVVYANDEAKVKAAFLLNFARLIEWPVQGVTGKRDLVIGILGRDPFGKTMESTVDGKTVEQRRIVVRRPATTAEATKCDVLFISNSERDRMDSILREFHGKPILTVSDIDGFCEAGGIIRLKKKQGTIRFDINWPAADGAGLKVSSKLLKLADNSPARQ